MWDWRSRKTGAGPDTASGGLSRDPRGDGFLHRGVGGNEDAEAPGHVSPLAKHSSLRSAGVRVLGLIVTAAAMALVAACATPVRLAPPVPSADTTRALPLGIPNARFFLGNSEAMLAEGTQAAIRRLVADGLMEPGGPQPETLPPVQFLAVSGGGDDGAFGAGLLVGWSEYGNRPEFQIVTGVSTGALIAPYAYLGAEYDDLLSEVYTTIGPEDIFEQRSLIGAIYGDAMADTSPLFALISERVDEQMMADLASAYEGGRLLLIGTTQLDAQVPVIWNIGAIAASGHPGALDLIHKILRASSAVPGMFQPVLIDVELDGETYQELHVDGGAIAQLFVYPAEIDLRQQAQRERSAYLIFNARHDPQWADVEPRTLSIAGRAISTMIHSSGINDIARIYFISQRDNVDFNLAFIGSDFDTPHADDFDPIYMNALYDYGYQLGRQGYEWRKAPPILERLREQELLRQQQEQ
ncbi:MAG: patatin-like phospholipase family protein [Alphaproteobacteria bacterium]